MPTYKNNNLLELYTLELRHNNLDTRKIVAIEFILLFGLVIILIARVFCLFLDIFRIDHWRGSMARPTDRNAWRSIICKQGARTLPIGC